ncbi:hypothetical protein PV08_05126 [Exophiala spinifera]|uniref:Major facilitator superfamily (MFS) profile domain-containing protein n=1 Tax=Exophiala spinifera TaxID=91928 RepID=A0A0D1YRR9_9EURO|nr:uncharacterized protein PV08_05126 [Exophiala spinifera]KIW17931.1 hypothetical protein PV08_05126 [Exophiala spinifera]
MSGINALGFYQSTIFEQYLRLSPTIARVLSACVFTFQTCCSPIGVLAVDKFGRRKLMMVSALGMGSCMAIVAGASSQSHNVACVGVACAFIFLFSLFFPIGFLGLTFLYASEISPLMARVPITAMSTGCAWIFNFFIAEITPTAFATIGWRYYIVFACTNMFLILPCVYIFFPETNRCSLEGVDQIFRDSKDCLQPVKMAARLSRGLLDEAVQTDQKLSNEMVECCEAACERDDRGRQ